VSDEFAPVTESAELADAIRARIAREGPITFRDFMEMALYDDRHGYYRTRAGVTGRGGDYVTSPEVHSMFGVMVGRQLREMWEFLDEPSRFDIVEQGAGRGLLARDIVAWARRHAPAFGAALRYRIVEPARVLREAQERTLEDAGVDGVAWLGAMPDGIEGCVLSNELLDAFPVHRVVREGGVLREVHVGVDAGRFVDVLGDPSTPEIAAYFDALGLLPGERCYAEVNLDAPKWIARVAASLTRGFVLTFDYGYEAEALYAPWRRDGTLLTFAGQVAGSDPYRRVGRQDITASVDFTTLRRAGEAAGLRTLGYTDQASFLARVGIGQALGAALGAVGGEGASDIEEYFARRSVVLALIDPARLGRVRVLLQGKDAPDEPLLGFADD
jgi:SAM-dependent MidA family methyltransferase